MLPSGLTSNNTNSIIFRFYYQHDTGCISACPVTIHALLHIADSIKTCGPVWCYWAFPMEHYCNCLKPAICNQQSPYATTNQYILEDAQLTQIKAIYNLADKLALQPCQRDLPLGAYQSPCCKSSPLRVTYCYFWCSCLFMTVQCSKSSFLFR